MMAEFLIRGWNVAIPEVDIGDDIFVVKDENGELRRVQVKTSSTVIRQNGFSGQFNLSYGQLSDIREVIIYYVFIFRLIDQWSAPIVIPQNILFDMVENQNVGARNGDRVIFYVSMNKRLARCKTADFTPFVNNFADFDIIPH